MAAQQSSPKWSLEKMLALTGVISSLIGVISTWVALQYRIERLEEQAESAEKKLELIQYDMLRMERDFNEQGRQVRCDICRAHGMGCPGC